MLGIFKDERRGNGGFARSPERVRSKSPRAASKMLESAPHFLALFSMPAVDLASIQIDAVMINRP
ncbi:MAG: hypothetical protein ACE363_10395 [Alphaproteobacteria bacterium]